MKRLLSWLVALAMIISCLPLSTLSVFAAESDGAEVPGEVDVDTTEGTADFEENFGDLAKPAVGSKGNPEVVENPGWISVSLEASADKSNAYYYSYTAPADGTVDLCVRDLPEGVSAEIVVNDTYSLSENGVDGYLTLEVKAEEVLVIAVSTVADENGAYPAAECSLVLTFTYPEGTVNNPIVIVDDNAEDNSYTGSATAPVGTTYYQANIGGMTLVVTGDVTVSCNGVEYAAGEEIAVPVGSFGSTQAVIAIVNAGESEAAFSIAANYPVGAKQNPAALVIGTNTANVAASSQYYYNWTAEQAGTLILDFSGDTNWYITVNNLTAGKYGDATDTESLQKVAVSAGDVVEVIVETFDYAADEIVFVASFEFPLGSYENPYILSKDSVTAITVPAGESVYAYVNANTETLDVSANSTVAFALQVGKMNYAASDENGNAVLSLGQAYEGYVVIMNTSETDGVVNATLVEGTPEDTTGTMGDPAELVMGTNTANVPEGSDYFFTWTAGETGYLVLDFSGDTNWGVTVNNKTTGAVGEYNNTDAVQKFVVTAGDVLEIVVSADNWTADEIVFKASVQTITKFDLSGTTTSLGNSLAINFVIDTSKLDGDGHYAVITKSYADGTADAVVTIPQADWAVYSGKLKYFSFTGVSAKEMTDQLVIKVYNSDGLEVTNAKTDSIRDYLMRMLINEEKKASPRPKVLTLYVDMLNYGAAAQNYFGSYHVDDLANSQLTEAQQAYATTAVSGEDVRVKGTGYMGTTLSLKSEIILNFVYSNSTIGNAAYAVVSYTDHYGNEKSNTIQSEDFLAYGTTGKYVAVSGMSVADCGQAITVVLYDASDNVLSTSVDSAISYVYRLSGGAEVYTMIWRFATSAYNYFH